MLFKCLVSQSLLYNCTTVKFNNVAEAEESITCEGSDITSTADRNACMTYLRIGLPIIHNTNSLSGTSTGQCSGAKTCSECIKTHYTCKWCKDENYDASRCQSDLNQDLGSEECVEWVFPQSSIEPDETEFGPIIQVKPSAIKITNLRPGM